MQRLPHVDTHVREIAAPPEAVWAALLAVVGHLGTASTPAAVAAVLANEPRDRTGDWRGAAVGPGDSVLGFAVREADPPRRLALTGRHRFSTYALTFTLRATDGGTLLAARSDAEFPGVAGRVYRALVIGTRGHVLVVRGLLRRVADRAA